MDRNATTLPEKQRELGYHISAQKKQLRKVTDRTHKYLVELLIVDPPGCFLLGETIFVQFNYKLNNAI